MKKSSKIILWGIVIILVLAVGGGFFWYWKKSKNQPDLEEDLDLPLDEDNSVDEMGFSTYKPSFNPNATEAAAKKEVLKNICKHRNIKSLREAEKIFLDVNAKIKENDCRKINEKCNWDKTKEIREIVKLAKPVFYNPPDQVKFDKAFQENKEWFAIAILKTKTPCKPNGEIDWKKLLQYQAEGFPGQPAGMNFAQAKVAYEELKEKNFANNNFLLHHARRFPKLTTLEELNEWVNCQSASRVLSQIFSQERWEAAKKIGKKTYSSEVTTASDQEKQIFKNPKFNLTYKFTAYLITDEKQ